MLRRDLRHTSVKRVFHAPQGAGVVFTAGLDHRWTICTRKLKKTNNKRSNRIVTGTYNQQLT